MWDKTAITLSGGGANGAFIVGAVKHLWETFPEEMSKIPVILGSSAGALIGAKLGVACVTGKKNHIERLVEVFSTVDREKIIKIKLQRRSLLDSGPISKLINRNLRKPELEKLIENKKNPVVGAVVYNSTTRKGELITNHARGMNSEIFRKGLLASAAIPFAFPAVDIYKNGTRYHDGCIACFNPVDILHEFPFHERIKRVIAISTGDAIEGFSSTASRLGGLLSKEMDLGILGRGLKALGKITGGKWLENAGKILDGSPDWEIVRVEPSGPLGDFLEFDAEKSKLMIRKGETAAKAVIGN